MQAGDEGAVGAGGGDVVQDDAVELVEVVGGPAVFLQELWSGELRGGGI